MWTKVEARRTSWMKMLMVAQDRPLTAQLGSGGVQEFRGLVGEFCWLVWTAPIVCFWSGAQSSPTTGL
jgi:hypothetical protein